MYVPSVGEKILNRGDMANSPHWLEVTAVYKDMWGTHVRVKVISANTSSVRKVGYEYVIDPVMIHDKDSGNGSTRFVTERAHKEWKEEQERQTAELIKNILARRKA